MSIRDANHRSASAARYLDLLKKSLLNELYPELEAQLLHTVLCLAHRQPVQLDELWRARDNPQLLAAIREVRAGGDSFALRGLDANGKVIDRPDLRNHTEFAHTMIGRLRLDHLQRLAEKAIADGIPGDFLEAGVWRGGACVLLAGVLAAYEVRDRCVWVADSFQGMPRPARAEDAGWDMSADVLPVLSVSEADVRQLFERYGLLDERIRFLPGWFKDSLPGCPVQQLALLRVDGDLYESTRDVLENLYARVADGGYVIVDDYRSLPPCRQAVEDFRAAHAIQAPLENIDGHAVFWRKGA